MKLLDQAGVLFVRKQKRRELESDEVVVGKFEESQSRGEAKH